MLFHTALGIHNQAFVSRRVSTRIGAKGIVALTGCGRPVVTRIHDIGAGGLSFLHLDGAACDELTMDVLLYDVQTDEEVLLSQVNGRVVAKKLTIDLERNAPIWRYNVEFYNLRAGHRRVLRHCLGLALGQLLGDRRSPVDTMQELPSSTGCLGGRRAVAIGTAR